MGITIVMYHFVRDVRYTAYPGIKALSVDNFRGQLDYLEQQHTVIRMEDLFSLVNGSSALPENAALLTFDDGTVDHYETVFPILVERGLQGSFFPPARPVVESCVLDVNKIHFISIYIFNCYITIYMNIFLVSNPFFF